MQDNYFHTQKVDTDENIIENPVSYLLKVNHHNEIKTYQLKIGDNVIGRLLTCEVPILHNSMSKRHALIEVTKNGSVFIQDLCSINGTFREGLKLREKVMYEIFNGISLCFGLVKAVMESIISPNFKDTQNMLVNSKNNNKFNINDSPLYMKNKKNENRILKINSNGKLEIKKNSITTSTPAKRKIKKKHRKPFLESSDSDDYFGNESFDFHDKISNEFVIPKRNNKLNDAIILEERQFSDNNELNKDNGKEKLNQIITNAALDDTEILENSEIINNSILYREEDKEVVSGVRLSYTCLNPILDDTEILMDSQISSDNILGIKEKDKSVLLSILDHVLMNTEEDNLNNLDDTELIEGIQTDRNLTTEIVEIPMSGKAGDKLELCIDSNSDVIEDGDLLSETDLEADEENDKTIKIYNKTIEKNQELSHKMKQQDTKDKDKCQINSNEIIIFSSTDVHISNKTIKDGNNAIDQISTEPDENSICHYNSDVIVEESKDKNQETFDIKLIDLKNNQKKEINENSPDIFDSELWIDLVEQNDLKVNPTTERKESQKIEHENIELNNIRINKEKIEHKSIITIEDNKEVSNDTDSKGLLNKDKIEKPLTKSILTIPLDNVDLDYCDSVDLDKIDTDKDSPTIIMTDHVIIPSTSIKNKSRKQKKSKKRKIKSQKINKNENSNSTISTSNNNNNNEKIIDDNNNTLSTMTNANLLLQNIDTINRDHLKLASLSNDSSDDVSGNATQRISVSPLLSSNNNLLENLFYEQSTQKIDDHSTEESILCTQVIENKDTRNNFYSQLYSQIATQVLPNSDNISSNDNEEFRKPFEEAMKTPKKSKNSLGIDTRKSKPINIVKIENAISTKIIQSKAVRKQITIIDRNYSEDNKENYSIKIDDDKINNTENNIFHIFQSKTSNSIKDVYDFIDDNDDYLDVIKVENIDTNSNSKTNKKSKVKLNKKEINDKLLENDINNDICIKLVDINNNNNDNNNNISFTKTRSRKSKGIKKKTSPMGATIKINIDDQRFESEKITTIKNTKRSNLKSNSRRSSIDKRNNDEINNNNAMCIDKVEDIKIEIDEDIYIRRHTRSSWKKIMENDIFDICNEIAISDSSSKTTNKRIFNKKTHNSKTKPKNDLISDIFKAPILDVKSENDLKYKEERQLMCPVDMDEIPIENITDPHKQYNNSRITIKKEEVVTDQIIKITQSKSNCKDNLSVIISDNNDTGMTHLVDEKLCLGNKRKRGRPKKSNLLNSIEQIEMSSSISQKSIVPYNNNNEEISSNNTTITFTKENDKKRSKRNKNSTIYGKEENLVIKQESNTNKCPIFTANIKSITESQSISTLENNKKPNKPTKSERIPRKRNADLLPSNDNKEKETKRRKSDNSNEINTSIQISIMFTGIYDTNYQKIIDDLGGRIVNDISETNHLVTDQVRRTVKFLCCLAKGMPIVTPDWLNDSRKKKRFVDVSPYIMKKNADMFNINVDNSIALAKKYQNLAGGIMAHHRCIVFVTDNTKPDSTQLHQIITSAGGKMLFINDVSFYEYLNDDDSIRICIADTENVNSKIPDLSERFKALQDKNIEILSVEFLLTMIMEQRLPEPNNYRIIL